LDTLATRQLCAPCAVLSRVLAAHQPAGGTFARWAGSPSILAATSLAGCGASSTSSTSTRATAGSHTSSSRGSGGKPRVIDGSFYSDAVDGTLHYSIALPPGYDTSGERYPWIPHVFEIYQGAHDGTFWREHQDEWLAAAVERLDPPERSGS
jgi:hypothetical protein